MLKGVWFKLFPRKKNNNQPWQFTEQDTPRNSEMHRYLKGGKSTPIDFVEPSMQITFLVCFIEPPTSQRAESPDCRRRKTICYIGSCQVANLRYIGTATSNHTLRDVWDMSLVRNIHNKYGYYLWNNACI